MKYSNELKVGISIILAGVIFVLGIRFFEDLPLFRTTYDLETELDDAAGLIPGNVVRVNGVTVGSVDEVFINPENNRVRVRFHVDRDVPVREGTETAVSGLDALGVVRMDLLLGPPGGEPVPSGGFLPNRSEPDLLTSLANRAPVLLDQVDRVMEDLGGVLTSSRTQLEDPASDVRMLLLSVRSTVGALDETLRAERRRVSSILTNVDSLTGALSNAVGGGDSLAAAVQDLRGLVRRMDATLAGLDRTLGGVDTLLGKINRGEGTVGLLVNDPSLYRRTDSVLVSIEALLADFRANPGRYLKEMRIVDLF